MNPHEVDQILPVISVAEVLRGVVRRRRMIIALTLASFALAIGLVNYLKPVYTTEARVLIENLATPFDRAQAEQGQAPAAVDDRVVASQMEVIKSADLSRRVVAALKLDETPEFNSLLKGLGTVRKIKLALGFGEDPRLKTPEQRALGVMVDGLSVYQQPNSNVIGIKFTSSSPQVAAKVANTLADVYVMATRESQSQPTERVREWLARQIDDLRAKLANSEQEIERFRTQADLLQGTQAPLTTQQISELSSQIIVSQTASAEARARADAINELLRNKGSVDSSPDVQLSPVVQRLKEQRAEAARAVAELSATYLTNHPKMIAAQSELANAERQLRGEALKIVSSLEDQANIAEAREQSLRDALDKAKSRESTANLDDVKLKALERDVIADRALLETMLGRYADASSRQNLAAQPGLARIIQTASVPVAPSFPKRGPMVVLVTFAGLAFSLGFAFLMEVMSVAAGIPDTMVTRPRKEETPAAAPVSQSAVEGWTPPAIPAMSFPIATVAATPSPGAAAILAEEAQSAGLGAALETWASGAGSGPVAVTSIGGAPGSSALIAAVLARAHANKGRRAVLVDLGRQSAWLEAICGLKDGPGICELVSGSADFTKVIGRDRTSTAHILRNGSDQSPAAQVLLRDRFESVMAALAKSYEFIVVNASEATADTPIFLRHCRAALVVAAQGHAGDAAIAIDALLKSGLAEAGHIIVAPLPARRAA